MGMSPSTLRGAPGKGAPMTARSMQYQPADMAGTSQYGNMGSFSGGIGAFRQPFTRDLPSGYDPNVHQPSIGFMPGFEGMQASASGPSTIPAGMQGDQLREQQAALDSMNQSRQRQMPMNQIGDMRFAQPDQASMQAQIDDMARRRTDPAAMYAQMLAMQEQGRRQVAQPMQPQVQQSPFGMPMQYRPPMQQPYQQPYYQQRMQPNMFGGLAALMPFLRRQY